MAHNKRMSIRAGRLLGLRSSDNLGDGGDAARAGGKGSGVVAGGVLDGVGVVAGGGVGVGDDNGPAFVAGAVRQWIAAVGARLFCVGTGGRRAVPGIGQDAAKPPWAWQCARDRDGSPKGRDSACRGSVRSTTARPERIAPARLLWHAAGRERLKLERRRLEVRVAGCYDHRVECVFRQPAG